MKFQRIAALMKKELIRMIKDPASLIFVVIFPIVITLAFGIAFGKIGIGNENATYNIALINLNAGGSHNEWAENFKGNLSANDLLIIEQYSENLIAQEDLQNGKLAGIVIIPSNFGDSIETFWANPLTPSNWINTTIEVYYDQSSLVITQALGPMIQQALISTIYGESALNTPSPVMVGQPLLVQASHLTQFDYMAPGLFAYSAIFLIMTVSQGISLEREKGLLKRLYLTPVTASEMMVAETSANMVAALIQTACIFLSAFLIGYNPIITVGSFGMAVLLVIIFSLCCVGFGLIVGTLAKNSGMATGLSFIFILPMMFLGTFIPLGQPTIANQIMPAWYVTEAIKTLFLRGAPVTSPTVLINLGVITVYSIVVFLIGIYSFKKFGKK